MRCPNCGTENLPGSRFCEHCGADLRTLANQGGGFAPPPSAPFGQGTPAQGGFPGSSPTGPTGWPESQPPTMVTIETAPRRRGRGCLIAIAIILIICVVLPTIGSIAFPTQVENFISTIETELTQQSLSQQDPTATP